MTYPRGLDLASSIKFLEPAGPIPHIYGAELSRSQIGASPLAQGQTGLIWTEEIYIIVVLSLK